MAWLSCADARFAPAGLGERVDIKRHLLCVLGGSRHDEFDERTRAIAAV